MNDLIAEAQDRDAPGRGNGPAAVAHKTHDDVAQENAVRIGDGADHAVRVLADVGWQITVRMHGQLSLQNLVPVRRPCRLPAPVGVLGTLAVRRAMRFEPGHGPVLVLGRDMPVQLPPADQ